MSVWYQTIDNYSNWYRIEIALSYINNNNKYLYSALACVTQSTVTQNEWNTKEKNLKWKPILCVKNKYISIQFIQETCLFLK